VLKRLSPISLQHVLSFGHNKFEWVFLLFVFFRVAGCCRLIFELLLTFEEGNSLFFGNDFCQNQDIDRTQGSTLGSQMLLLLKPLIDLLFRGNAFLDCKHAQITYRIQERVTTESSQKHFKNDAKY